MLLSRVGLPALAALMLAACAPRTTQFYIADHRTLGPPTFYAETFDEAFYRTDAQGNVDLILRRERPGRDDPDQPVIQVIHIRTFWRAIPGTTVADTDQINATVSYLIVSGQIGATFEGAGSLFFKHHKRGDVLTGELERAYLTPMRRLNQGKALFEHAELAGEFRAERNPRKVVRILNEMEQLFGPLPLYHASSQE